MHGARKIFRELGRCEQSSKNWQGVEQTYKKIAKKFLARSLDLFAWKHADIVGKDPKVACHTLKLDPKIKSMVQMSPPTNTEKY